jgi:hypothetical protein
MEGTEFEFEYISLPVSRICGHIIARYKDCFQINESGERSSIDTAISRSSLRMSKVLGVDFAELNPLLGNILRYPGGQDSFNAIGLSFIGAGAIREMIIHSGSSFSQCLRTDTVGNPHLVDLQ